MVENEAEQDDCKTDDSQDLPMPDWQKLVREHLAARRLNPAIEDDVVQELADHLEDACDASLKKGLSKEESFRRAWAEVSDWTRLARRIAHARRGEEMLTQRIHALWLPGAVMMTLSLGTLYGGLHVGILPRIIWLKPGIAILFYVPWVLILPLFGALAAYWSRRVGGSVKLRVAAALLPVGAMLVLLLLLLFVALFTDHGVPTRTILIALASNLVGWVVAPGAALLVGALPFLRVNRRATA